MAKYQMEPYQYWIDNWEEEAFGEGPPSKEYYKKCEKIYCLLQEILNPVYPPVPCGDKEFEFTLRFDDYMVALSLNGPRFLEDEPEEDSINLYCCTWPEDKDIDIETVFDIFIPAKIVQAFLAFGE